MRKLTIKRQKSFVGCLGKMKVYIEDPTSGDLAFGGVAFRKLGTLKNGEEATFEIGNGESRVCVIADKWTKGYCNDFYPLPEGEEDIYLSGKNHYNPVKGNPFYFDGVTDPEMIKNRKKGTMIGIAVFVGALALGVVVGLYSSGLFESNDPKTFTYDDMQITLTEAFDEDFVDGFDVAYVSDHVGCFAFYELIGDFENGNAMTAKDYGESIMEINDIDLSKLQILQNGMPGFTETDTVDGVLYNYYYFFYKGETAFWMLQFTVESSENAQYEQQIYDWASTVRDKE